MEKVTKRKREGNSIQTVNPFRHSTRIGYKYYKQLFSVSLTSNLHISEGHICFVYSSPMGEGCAPDPAESADT